MKYFPHQYAAALLSLVEESPAEERRVVMRKFFSTLAAHGALSMIRDIVREVETLLDVKKNLKRVLVRSAERESEERVRRKLHFKAAVSSVKDVRLRGGAIVETDGVRVDNSVARRLQRLREALVK